LEERKEEGLGRGIKGGETEEEFGVNDVRGRSGGLESRVDDEGEGEGEEEEDGEGEEVAGMGVDDPFGFGENSGEV
jgi:hypothetical protein